jgi:hypothetical protein
VAYKRRAAIQQGDLVRVLFVPEKKARLFFEGRIGVVRTTYGFRALVQRIIGVAPGVIKECGVEHIERLREETLSDTECAQLAAWRLTQ